MVIEKKIIYEKEGRPYEKKIIVFEKQKEIQVLSNPIAWKILRLISDRPSYTAQIAKQLKIYERSAYYYVRKLVSIGAIEESGTHFVKGGTAKTYTAT